MMKFSHNMCRGFLEKIHQWWAKRSHIYISSLLQRQFKSSVEGPQGRRRCTEDFFVAFCLGCAMFLYVFYKH
ncbi:hypothetical protein BJX64DRAFT_263834 [Aspergillus heterothallicus]